MADTTPLTLGSVTFTGITAPTELAFPHSQSTAEHTLIGGRIIVQTLGVVWRNIQWEGTLWGKDADAQSTAISKMLANATTQRLQYLTWALDVIVNDYTPTYRHQYKIEYKISCTVVRDQSGKTVKFTPPSVDSQISKANQNANAAYQTLAGQNHVA